MNSGSRALIVFMRCPRPGRVKTRLAADVGPAAACDVYERLLRRVLGAAADFGRSAADVDLFLFTTPGDDLNEIRSRFPGPWSLEIQSGDHLGARMEDAFNRVFDRGYRAAVLVGSDIAGLAPADFAAAFDGLESHRAVLGPVPDGGFYLIGLTGKCPAPFRTDSWSHAGVFDRTRRLIEESGCPVGIAPTRRDVDRAEDLACLVEDPLHCGTLSIVIPALRTGPRLARLIARLEAQLWPGDEILVVLAAGDGEVGTNGRRRFPMENEDGGVPVTDRTRVLRSPQGRGLQMNRGAAAANGDVLWFLHADSRPPANFAYHARKILCEPGRSFGCFHLAFSSDDMLMEWVAGWANFRTRVLKLPYGDQGFFCRRDVFQRLGGFRKRFLMEDVEFVADAARLGPFLFLNECIVTSPRRYQRKGILRAIAQNHLLMLLHRLGVDDRKLCDWYYGAGPPAGNARQR